VIGMPLLKGKSKLLEDADIDCKVDKDSGILRCTAQIKTEDGKTKTATLEGLLRNEDRELVFLKTSGNKTLLNDLKRWVEENLLKE